MGAETKIEWCDHTCNLWWGCSHVHAGCDHCYAETFARRVGKGDAWEDVRYYCPNAARELRGWDQKARAAGRVDRVFVGSMMDVLEKGRPLADWKTKAMLGIGTDDARDEFFRQVVRATPNLEYLLLTKRPGNAKDYLPRSWYSDWPKNVMLGASVSDQKTADILVPQLLQVPGRLFLSVEPLLAEVDLTPWLGRLAWTIVGGESGPRARPCDIDWIRSIVRQCKEAGVACFVKQLGARPGYWFGPNVAPGSVTLDTYDMPGGEPDEEWMPLKIRDPKGGGPSEWPEDLRVREFPAATGATR